MELVQADQIHLIEMMTWFKNKADLIQWAGPNFRYPYTAESFTIDLNLKNLSSWCMVSDANDLLAFGQFYQRLGKCHLGRLVVHPRSRGRGLGGVLVEKLRRKGRHKLSLKDSSLFVLEHNISARKLYLASGFVEMDYPETIPMDNCLYMVKQNDLYE